MKTSKIYGIKPGDELFHGTSIKNALSIKEKGIDLNANKNLGDFGKGFYLTTSFVEAKSHALKPRNVNPKGEGAVLIFEANDNIKNVIGKEFESRNDYDWQIEVLNQRFGIDDGLSDIISGPIADGLIKQIVERACHDINKVNKKAFISAICYGKEIGDQVTVKTVKATKAIKYVDHIIVKEDD